MDGNRSHPLHDASAYGHDRHDTFSSANSAIRLIISYLSIVGPITYSASIWSRYVEFEVIHLISAVRQSICMAFESTKLVAFIFWDE